MEPNEADPQQGAPGRGMTQLVALIACMLAIPAVLILLFLAVVYFL